MPKTMLIDATHDEETRVAVVDGHRLVEYDYESKVRKQLKGSVFLAKVTRVEPSLQAAFVNFGGNRHGFLPFSEIHPDYFRIPVADREALIAAQRAELEEHDEEMEQEDAVLEQAAANEGQPALDDAEEDEEEDDIPAVVEVGGEDQPITDEDDAELDEHAEEAELPPRRPMAMEAPAERLEATLEDDMGEPEDHEEAEQPDEEMTAAEFDGEEEEDEDHDHETLPGMGEQPDVILDGAHPENRGPRALRSNDRGRGRNRRFGRGAPRSGGRHGGADRDDQSVETLGGDSVEGDRPFRFNMRKSYKIQEVIKRGQIMLIQISKEERGNKGAAVTTYLSMPGRYCVLMPNSPRGGGVSRKIASFKDRKRMKDMLTDLSVPDGMSVILRTAGVTRTKVEIKRDLDYLTRLWNTIREHTLQSTAPALIYEEGSLIKRAIRDLYSRDIEDIYVSGDEGFRAAKDFMKMLMPSHAKKIQEYNSDKMPMFHKFGVENQISEIGEPVVNLRSGGYLVINPTEALVSVDVNSGKATKERHIEETAVKTNLEAADEVARQLRLRDLGGLVVIDFIDMEDRRNNRKVEQRLRDALSTDRARIQVGRISSFGLLELSRQRLNPSLAEAQQEICPHCLGIGRVKTLDFSAISVIRALEMEGIRARGMDITLTVPTAVAIYVMNHKRKLLADIEARYGFDVTIATDDMMSTSQFTIEQSARSLPKISEGIKIAPPLDSDLDDLSEDESDDLDGEEAGVSQSSERIERTERSDDQPVGPDGRRRRGRRGGRARGPRRDDEQQGDRPMSEASNGNVDALQDDPNDNIGNVIEGDPEAGLDQTRFNRDPADPNARPRRSRGRRGGRGREGREARPPLADGQPREPREPREPRPPREPRELRAERPVNDALSAPVAAGPSFAPTMDTPSPSPSRSLAAPSNDRSREPQPPRDYEKVNEAPEKKKKGWWNRLVE